MDDRKHLVLSLNQWDTGKKANSIRLEVGGEVINISLTDNDIKPGKVPISILASERVKVFREDRPPIGNWGR